ncbi:MAG: chromosome segregation protein SMC, partial [Bacteroidota bacterium]
KEAEKGKANFFVLSTLAHYLNQEKEGSLADDTSLFFGGINPVDIQTEQEENLIRALSIIHFDPEHRPLVHYLFDNLYLVEDLSQIQDQPDPNKSFVSLNGEVIQRKYSISGGSVGSFEGKRLGRVKQLEQLALEIQELEAQIQEQKEVLTQKQEDLRELKNNQQLKQAFEEASRHLSQINEKYVSLRSKKEQLSTIIQNNRERREDVQQRVNDLQDQIEDISPNLQEENQELDYLSDEIADLKDQLEIENEKLRQQSSAYNDLKIRYHQVQNMVDSTEQKIDYQEKSQDDLKKRLIELGDNLQTAEADYEKLLESQENFDDELIGLQSQSQDYELNVQSAEQSYYALRGEISDMEKDIKNQQNLKEQQDSLLQELQNKAYETNLSLNSIQERLSVEFHIQLDELFREPTPEATTTEEEGEEEDKSPKKEKKTKLNLEEMTEEELKSEAENIKGKMERIGSINPMAMEAYQEMKERSDFITKQKNDLMESKQSLLKTINEMEDYARSAFMEAYEQIRSN